MRKFLFTAIVLWILQSNLKAQKPNVLLIFADDLNTQIGPYTDIEGHTPNLNRLANEGVKFTHAYSQYPISGPSRASVMSGLYPETNGVLTNNDQPGSYKKETSELSNHPSIAGFFRENGYFTARVSKIFHMGVPGGIERGEPGGDEPDSWDYTYNVMAPETLSPGKLELMSPKSPHYGANFARMIISDENKETQADYMAATQAIAILENRAGNVPKDGTNKQRLKKDAPFFLAVGFVRPHVPFIIPESFYKKYSVDEIMLPEIEIGDNVPAQALQRQNEKIFGMNEIQKKMTISGYLASVQFMDEQVGRLLDALERLELKNETIVVFLSDHGYNLGEHDCWSKISLWEGSVRVPLILSVPGINSTNGHTCDIITELIDLYPTLVELCGFSGQEPAILQGKSLAKHIVHKTIRIPEESHAYTITNEGQDGTLRTKYWRYTRWGNEAVFNNEELYNHSEDPEELNNLADNPHYQHVLNEMRAKYEERKSRALNDLDKLRN